MARATHVRKMYVKGDEVKRSAFPGWEILRFEMVAPEKVNDDFVTVDTYDVRKADIVEAIADCAMGHGLSQKLGDNLAGIDKKVAADNSELPAFDPKTGYAAAIRALLEEQMEDLRNGIWVSEAEGGGGGNITILLEAIVAAFKAEGQELTEEQVGTFKTQLQNGMTTKDGVELDGKGYQKVLKSSPAIAAQIARINKERADARAKEAQKRAKEAGASNLADLL